MAEPSDIPDTENKEYNNSHERSELVGGEHSNAGPQGAVKSGTAANIQPNYCHIIVFMGVMIASGASFIYGQVIAN